MILKYMEGRLYGWIVVLGKKESKALDDFARILGIKDGEYVYAHKKKK